MERILIIYGRLGCRILFLFFLFYFENNFHGKKTADPVIKRKNTNSSFTMKTCNNYILCSSTKICMPRSQNTFLFWKVFWSQMNSKKYQCYFHTSRLEIKVYHAASCLEIFPSINFHYFVLAINSNYQFAEYFEYMYVK